MSKSVFWNTIFMYMKPFKKQFVIAMICSVFAGAAVALQPMVIKFIVDEGVNRQGASPHEKIIYALIFCVIYLIISIGRISIFTIGYRQMVGSVEGILFSLRSSFFRHVQSLSIRFHEEVSSGELFNYIMGSPMNSLKTFMHQASLNVPTQMVAWFVGLGTLIYFDWLMALIFFATIVLIAFVNSHSRKAIKEMSADFMKTESTASRYIANMLQGTRAIKIYAAEDEVIDKFESQIESIRDQSIKLTVRQQLEVIKPEGLQYIGMAFIFFTGAYSCIYRGMSVGVLFAFISSINALMSPLMMLFQLNLIKGNAEAGLERITSIMNMDKTTPELPLSQQKSVAAEENESRKSGSACIEFDQVSFAYTEKSVLKNITCQLEYGKSVALVGGSGAGKSTFAALLLRLYDPQSGSIRLYGSDLKDYALQDLRSSFGVVPQDPFMFQTSIFENIRVVKPEATREEVQKAVEMAYLSEFVDNLAQGIHTQIGEGGFNLSGGQKQRIAIARAILGNPRIIIFDEATSALDNHSERQIQKAMEELMKKHTIITIAHRLTTIIHMDRILVFDKGKILQDGNYEELSKQPGLFFNLLNNE